MIHDNVFKSIKCPKCDNVFSIPEKDIPKNISCPLCGSKIEPLRNIYANKIISRIRYLKKRYQEEPKWYHRIWFIILMIIIYPIAGLLLLWISPIIKRWQKVVITIMLAIMYFAGPFYTSYNYSIYNSPIQMISDIFYAKGEEPYLPTLTQEPSNVSYYDYARVGLRQGYILKTKDIAALFKPSVVKIFTYDKYGKEKGVGTGFIITRDGFIVTNYHVIRGAYSAKVILDNDREYEKVYWAKSFLGAPIDMVLLKIDANNLRPVLLGDSDKIEIGEDVIVIGSPLGLEGSVSKGVVSEVRDLGKIELIQITAPISPGNSGGPVFNEHGEVIGVASLASRFGETQNINFATPINYLKYPIYYQNPKFSKELGKMVEDADKIKEQIYILANKIEKQKVELEDLKEQAESAASQELYYTYEDIAAKYEELRKSLNQNIHRYRLFASQYDIILNKIKDKIGSFQSKKIK